VQRFGDAYEAAKRAAGVVDYDDLIAYPARILASTPLIAEAYGRRYGHVLVDEFQDTDPAQFSVIRSLMPHTRTTSVFADDDQAVFAFRHADPRQVRVLVEEAGAATLPLTTNYRCREEIVAVGNRLLDADPRSSGRRMRAFYPGGSVVARSYANLQEEAEATAEDIGEQIERGAQPHAIAVLSRNGYREDVVVAELIRRGIPVSDWRGVTYGREERKALAACLAVVRGTLSRSQVRRLCQIAELTMIDDRRAVDVIAALDGTPIGAGLREVQKLAYSSKPPAEVVAAAAHAIAAAQPDLAEGVYEVASGMGAFVSADPDFTLEHVLSEIAVATRARPPTQGGGVRIATLHGTKGLEWPLVYMLGLEEGQLPDYRATTTTAVSEERRCCFVGACRASDRLVLSRIRRNKGFEQRPSRFLAEMGLIQAPA